MERRLAAMIQHPLRFRGVVPLVRLELTLR
jgi:hypothetical protein